MVQGRVGESGSVGFAGYGDKKNRVVGWVLASKWLGNPRRQREKESIFLVCLTSCFFFR